MTAVSTFEHGATVAFAEQNTRHRMTNDKVSLLETIVKTNVLLTVRLPRILGWQLLKVAKICYLGSQPLRKATRFSLRENASRTRGPSRSRGLA
ncbi:hypothetical protein B0A52_08167 [Exophiala mesophila]|uniref:Uncharacterized protein n=1 Tax=Exophiala mesophila TaxID=212818 RepID=A0A438MV61_EXOME|nr:hypothetical protein B0A52_08167 [Exophiala mesophila]